MRKRTVLITGASRGIGLAVAERASRDGHRVIGLARSRPATPFPGDFYAVDLANAKATEAALADIAARHDIDSVVNNAGLTTSSLLEETSVDELDRILAINLRAPLQCVQACLPSMIRSGQGSIVNIASRAALGMPRRTAYSGAKSGLIGYTRTWALELGRHGITVNAVAPGPVETQLYRNNNPMTAEERQALENRIPMRRLGQPEDIAGTIAFFLSADARFVTGQVLYACGGLSVGAAPI
ncbi:NAD(P)-dependent dehydrogenase (short-subunit alcohol dehydrogenase family) [Cupriavidus gilardii J11]|uniref:NAD(P)-dependent dehydrogenase (Short-subunit alcohol dehydrogenase family) n=1 Tax=Cupriavidus gilardii J11 TaxID=936133 RepID=A0A562B9M9_9BURK|nr:SDR family oxidoreductase [Cupriavidus gilardii]TWG81864.1 NAD(P)-dependent dehydrogenase (short-subunit alcohol dehydrogenase family) [Cupriavidus gilardii J11]